MTVETYPNLTGLRSSKIIFYSEAKPTQRKLLMEVPAPPPRACNCKTNKVNDFSSNYMKFLHPTVLFELEIVFK